MSLLQDAMNYGHAEFAARQGGPLHLGDYLTIKAMAEQEGKVFERYTLQFGTIGTSGIVYYRFRFPGESWPIFTQINTGGAGDTTAVLATRDEAEAIEFEVEYPDTHTIEFTAEGPAGVSGVTTGTSPDRADHDRAEGTLTVTSPTGAGPTPAAVVLRFELEEI